MKTFIITGATQGIGRGIALQQIQEGNKVIAIGNSNQNGQSLVAEAKSLAQGDNLTFVQADLSLVAENKRVIEYIQSNFTQIDGLIMCAAKHSQTYTETAEGFETTLALAYLSRYELTYGLKDLLEKGNEPFILNVCGTGMKGDVNWEDLGFKKKFVPMKVMMHGSRLNDLLAVQFANENPSSNIHYILYNPMAVKTPGMDSTGGFLMKLIFKMIAKPVSEAIKPIGDIIKNRPTDKLISFTQKKVNSLTMETFNQANAKRLDELTRELLG